MHNHDDMSSLCTEMVLGMTHKLNGTPEINIAINGLKFPDENDKSKFVTVGANLDPK